MRDDSGMRRYVVQCWEDGEMAIAWKTADVERAGRIRELAEEDGYDAEVVTVLPYRARDIGYGVEEGEVFWPALGAPDWTGKAPYATPGGAVVYLFCDEVLGP